MSYYDIIMSEASLLFTTFLLHYFRAAFLSLTRYMDFAIYNSFSLFIDFYHCGTDDDYWFSLPDERGDASRQYWDFAHSKRITEKYFLSDIILPYAFHIS